MVPAFTITTADDAIRAEYPGQAEVTFTVTNVTSERLRARALVPKEEVTDKKAWPWFSVVDENRDFPASGSHQYKVRLAPVKGAEGNGTFKLKVVAIDDHPPDEWWALGPAVGFQVSRGPEPPPNGVPRWVWVVAVVLLLAAVGTLTWWLWPRSVIVPNVVGQPLEKATEILEEADLEVGDVRKQETDRRPNTVLSQEPKARDKRRTGTSVDLVIAAPGSLVPVPDIRGMTLRDAAEALKKVGLGVGDITPHRLGTVETANPRPGVRVPRGSRVDLRMRQ